MSHVPEPLEWIRPPRQVRTQESLERLLDAAEALLEEKRFEDVHVSEVARLADTSVAAFYRRFKDKDALLHALHERLCEEAMATADDALAPARWEGKRIAAILESVVPFLIGALEGREALDRAVYQRGLSDEVMRERSNRLLRAVMERLSRLMLDRREEIHCAEPVAAVSFALVQLISVLVHTYTAGLREIELVPTNDEQLSRRLVSSCLAYLGVRGDEADTTSDSDSGRTRVGPRSE